MSAKAIISYRTGKGDSANTDDFVQDLRERVIGIPEISTDGFHPYKPAIRDAFNNRASHVAGYRVYLPMWQPEERAMPVILLWAVPAVFVLGGLTYVLVK